jgi:hypothetical protein
MAARIITAVALSAAFCAHAGRAQTLCPSTPQYSVCDLVFEIPSANNGQQIDLQAEFRSPRQATALVRAFWDGGTRWLIRFTPAESGNYVYRVTSSLPGLGGKEGQFTVTPVKKPGWLRAANVHHFANVDGNNLTPHLWMGAVVPGFTAIDIGQWKQLVDTRSRQHFNHLAVTLVDGSAGVANFKSPEFFRAAEEKIRYANQNGIIIDVAFFGPDGLLNKLLPERDDRQKWFTYALSRLSAFDVTWQGVEAWETYDNGRDLLKEIGDYLANLDPYKHTRSTRTNLTSGPLVDDGWLRYRSYQTEDAAVGAIEQQMYQYPAVNNFIGTAGPGVDADTFRRRLWNATVSGQYPATLIPNDQAANLMKIWYEFMDGTRHWELEPFFDADGGRGLELEGVEYIIYVEKPGPVTVHMESHGYDGEWFNPATGESVKIKNVKGEVFKGETPDRSHDWVLHISREGHKASMLKSYRFTSREQDIVLQEIEGNPEKVPFDVVEPAADTISLSSPTSYAVKLKRESKALEHMMYEWTGEVTADGRSYRVIGTDAKGSFSIPDSIARNYPAAMHVRIIGMNGLGKVYTLDRNYTLKK